MTSPPTSSPASAAPLTAPQVVPPAPPQPVRFPLSWLLEHAAPPIKYRAVVDVARLPGVTGESLASLPLTYGPALTLAFQQGPEGTWNQAMLSLPAQRAERFEGVGTIAAVRRLLEYGWDRDTPPLVHARRVLFRLLAEDDDREFLFEFSGKGSTDDELVRRTRTVIREAAAAALAHAGYEGDPRLRGAARRILDRVGTYLRSPLAKKPFVRIGNQHVLPAEAAPPSIYAMIMVAYMPLFRTEHHEFMESLYEHLAQTLPRQEPVQVVGKKAVAQPHLVLGDMLPHRNAADTDIVFAMAWLELMARLGFLKRNENWTKLFDRFLDERDDEGIWHPRKGSAVLRTTNPFAWPIYPLENSRAGDERWTDLTFRLGLIARLAGRPIDVV